MGATGGTHKPTSRAIFVRANLWILIEVATFGLFVAFLTQGLVLAATVAIIAYFTIPFVKARFKPKPDPSKLASPETDPPE
ncbi:MAG: hypothetical protein B5766_03800 [Candidatus Lumbricidophila eiseniae]|uniref:Uncharacterized protein n=1 Tax=Candidatus Lumbricidiphila eiseniae TaxID=1969409 RepID=A0A2A6FT98_9MICO|nr:MAG: hypothetical protein B5766_03800 [Candidatus Lumbricidophila eiseniae]